MKEERDQLERELNSLEEDTPNQETLIPEQETAGDGAVHNEPDGNTWERRKQDLESAPSSLFKLGGD